MFNSIQLKKMEALLFVLFALVGTTTAVYVEESGNPYLNFSLADTVSSFILTPQDDGIPMQVRVDYPAIEDEVAVVLFVSGWGGFVPGAFYSDYLSQVAAHGFVVISPLTLNGGLDLENTLLWLEQNLTDYLVASGTVPSFQHMGMACHSAGCADIINLLTGVQDPSISKAIIMMDPFAFGTADIDLDVPVVLYGTNASCTLEGLDYISIYDRWLGPKVRTGSDLHGHCDIMDDSVLGVCRTFCPGGPPSEELLFYRQTMQGMTAAVFIEFLQGRGTMDYVLDPALIPTPPTDHFTDEWSV